jgi:drug/metabolite transporter (DMT)-like permease
MASRTPLWDWSLLMFCNLIWASQFVMVKLVQVQLGPIAATLLPMTLATILLVPIVLHERRGLTQAVRDARAARRWQVAFQFILLGLFGQVVAQLCITWGMRFASASNAALLFLALPVITAVMARAILGEHMTTIRWISFALAIVGAAACSGIDWGTVSLSGDNTTLGTGLVLLSICGSAFYNVYSKRLLTSYSPLEVLLYSYFAVLAFLIPIAWALEPATYTHFTGLTAQTLTGIGVLAVFQYSISMVAFLAVLTRLNANQAALGNYLIPFFGLVIAAVFLGERLQWPMILGGALVLASTILATLGDSDRSRATAAESAS